MDIFLPEGNGLAIRELSSLFDNMSESYKLFWFSSILRQTECGKQEMTFREILGGMITKAWYMVTEFHLNLGPSDTLEKLVLYLQEVSRLLPNADREDIIDFLNDSDDKTIQKYLYTLTLNVPYRLQAPFIQEACADDWNRLQLMREKIRDNDLLIYTMDEGKGLDRKLFVRDGWYAYLRLNRVILEGWIEAELIHYLQKRNPTVPGISEKLYPPTERDLKKAKDFWRAVIGETKIINIYSPDKEVMTAAGLSLDHFVPWSYVAHDELWNLTPTTRPFNSSKSNRLPDWDVLFPDFGNVQYEAYKARWNSYTIQALFEKTKGELINSREALRDLYDLPDLSHNDFMTRLDHLLKPTWQAARDQGFQIWQRLA